MRFCAKIWKPIDAADQHRQHHDADDESLGLDERQELRRRDDEDAIHWAAPAGAFISSAVGFAMRTKMSCSEGLVISK